MVRVAVVTGAARGIGAASCAALRADGFEVLGLDLSGAELAADEEDRLIRALRDGAQDTINQAGQAIVQRQLQVAPTLTIRPGFPVRIIVTRDLVFEPAGG